MLTHLATVSGRQAHRRRALSAAFALVALLLTGSVALAQDELQAQAQHRSSRALRFDVAMDGSSFHFQGPTNAAGFPADGTPFIIRGYIYPAGTFDEHGSNSGTNPDGTAQFPDLVLGTWYCRGWHLQDGDALTGPIVATTQVFDLDPDEPGSQTIVTDGIELADFGVAFDRAIVGGSGRYANPKGLSKQIYVDLNASFGFNTSGLIRLRR